MDALTVDIHPSETNTSDTSETRDYDVLIRMGGQTVECQITLDISMIDARLGTWSQFDAWLAGASRTDDIGDPERSKLIAAIVEACMDDRATEAVVRMPRADPKPGRKPNSS